MKTPFVALLFAIASSATLPAAVTITIANNVPDGSASGGGGSGGGILTTSQGNISSNRGMPTTTYTVSNVDLSSVGGSANYSFTFTVTYTATTDGSTSTAPSFNSFGNVAIGNNLIDGTETLTATIAIASSTFAGLTLTGFTDTRIGNLTTTGESGTLTHGGGTTPFSQASGITYPISGNFVTYDPDAGTTVNFEGFTAQFVAVPEPTSLSLIALGSLALFRRRRTI